MLHSQVNKLWNFYVGIMTIIVMHFIWYLRACVIAGFRRGVRSSLFYAVGKGRLIFSYFLCYTVHVVELLNYYTNHCTYIKII